MLELIIIISLAIIFFIFLLRMPEVERIAGKEKTETKSAFKGLFARVRNLKSKVNRPVEERKKESLDLSENGSISDLFSAAEEKVRLGDLSGAEKIYLRLAVVSPQEAKVYAALGKIYFDRLNYKDAIASFKAAVNRDPKNGFYYYDLAIALFKDEKYEEANLCFEKSILINNRIPIRHLGLGLSLMKLGENERAAASFRRAHEIEPNNEKYKKLIKRAEAKKYSLPS